MLTSFTQLKPRVMPPTHNSSYPWGLLSFPCGSFPLEYVPFPWNGSPRFWEDHRLSMGSGSVRLDPTVPPTSPRGRLDWPAGAPAPQRLIQGSYTSPWYRPCFSSHLGLGRLCLAYIVLPSWDAIFPNSARRDSSVMLVEWAARVSHHQMPQSHRWEKIVFKT